MLQDAIKQAQGMLRENLEATYDGRCTVYVKMPYKDPERKVAKYKEVVTIKDKPCHVSYGSSPPATESSTAATKSQVIKLFIAPEIEIEPGSKIVVVQNGRMEIYKGSGQPAVYSSHQEIELELWKEYT